MKVQLPLALSAVIAFCMTGTAAAQVESPQNQAPRPPATPFDFHDPFSFYGPLYADGPSLHLPERSPGAVEEPGQQPAVPPPPANPPILPIYDPQAPAVDSMLQLFDIINAWPGQRDGTLQQMLSQLGYPRDMVDAAIMLWF